MDLDKLVSFSRLITTFAGIERIVPVPGAKRMENDVEHSYHLALMAWYLVTSKKLDLNVDKVLKYALIHDLVEVYAGDTFIWSKNEADHTSKHEREEQAAKQLEAAFPEFPELHETIRDYEAREDKESRFVYALDKLVPMILIRDDGGSLWKEHQVTSDMQRTKKGPQIALSPEVVPYFEELMERIRDEKLTADFN